jgi:RNA recognition motif-containing protein
MVTKIYVGNLSDQTTEQDLELLFRPYGKVAYTEVIIELTGRGKSFGFVEMNSAEAAGKAIGELSGRRFKDQVLIVSRATDEEEIVGPLPGAFGDRGGSGGGDFN